MKLSSGHTQLIKLRFAEKSTIILTGKTAEKTISAQCCISYRNWPFDLQ